MILTESEPKTTGVTGVSSATRPSSNVDAAMGGIIGGAFHG